MATSRGAWTKLVMRWLQLREGAAEKAKPDQCRTTVPTPHDRQRTTAQLTGLSMLGTSHSAIWGSRGRRFESCQPDRSARRNAPPDLRKRDRRPSRTITREGLLSLSSHKSPQAESAIYAQRSSATSALGWTSPKRRTPRLGGGRSPVSATHVAEGATYAGTVDDKVSATHMLVDLLHGAASTMPA